MDRVETKNWAKEKIKGHIWELLIPIVVANILTNLTLGAKTTIVEGKIQTSSGISVGLFFYFVEVGLAYFMVKFITDKEYNFKDIFYFAKDYVRTFLVGLLEVVFVILWGILLIVPGIIKLFAYSLVPLLLADDKYKDLGYLDVLKKSEEIMNGHKMDYFVFALSFIGWFLLIVPTLGLICIWLIPYFNTAKYKFLNDIKTQYEN